MTPRELCDRAEGLTVKATKGPWASGPGQWADAQLYWHDVPGAGQLVGPRIVVAERRSFLCRDDTDFAAASRDLVPQLAAALREACEWVDDLTDDDEPGVMCHRCGAYDTHRGDCPKTLARAFLARDVEVESGV